MIETTIDGYTGDLMTVSEFKEACEEGYLIDNDGMGDLVKDGKIVTPEPDTWDIFPNWIYPSQCDTIPDNVTHILWYNK